MSSTATIRSVLVRASLGVLALSQGMIGVWALVGPASFFADFPRASHAWVSVLPPYNEHLTRDVGALSLALTVVLAAAGLGGDRRLSRLAALAFAVYAVPHTVFHALHLDHLSTADAIAQTAGFVLQLLLVVIVLAATRVRHDRPSTPDSRPSGDVSSGGGRDAQ